MREPILRRGPSLAVLVAGTFVGVMEHTVVVTALPHIGRAFPDSAVWLPWLLATSLVGAALAMPLGGHLADIWGPKRTFSLGVGLFAAGSLLSGLVGLAVPPETGLLLAARALQGLGGGVFAPVALKVAGALYGGRSRTQAVGLAAAVGPLATIAGPLLGGYLADHFPWQVIFLVNVPPMLLVGSLALWLLPEMPRARGRGSDAAGMLLLAGTLLATMLALTLAGHSGVADPRVFSTALLALLLGLLLVSVERRQAAPLLDPRVLGQAGTAAIFPLAFVQGVVAYGTIYFVSLYVQTHPHLRATGTQAGLVLVAGALGQAIAAPLAGRLVPRLGYRRAVLMGTLALALPLLALAMEPTALGLVGALVFASRAGSAMVRVPLAAAGLEAAHDRAGLISGLRQLSDVVGGAVGPVALAALLAGGSYAPGSFGWVFASMGLLLLLSLALARGLPESEPPTSAREPETADTSRAAGAAGGDSGR